MINKSLSYKRDILVILCEVEVLLFVFEKSYNILFDLFQTNYPPLTYPIYALIGARNLLLFFVAILAFSSRKGWVCSLIFALLIGGSVYYTSINFPLNMEYVSPLYMYFLSIFVLSKLIPTDYLRIESLIEMSIKVSRILVPIIIIARAIFPNALSYMTFSDAISLPCALLIASGYSGKRIDMYLGIISLVAVLLFGGRGSLLSLLLLFVMLVLFNRANGKIKPIYIVLIIISPILFELLQSLVDISSSRTMNLFVSGEIGYDSSRLLIYETLIPFLANNPMGIGMRGDRVMLEYFNMGDSNVAYSHNIFLEILLTFGMVIGIIIIIYLMYLFIWKLMFKQMDIKIKGFLLSFFTVSFLQLLTSRSFLTETNFYLLIFMLVNIAYNNNKVIHVKHKVSRL